MFKYFVKRFILDSLALVLLAIIVYFLMVSVRGNPLNPTTFQNHQAYLDALVRDGIARWKTPAKHAVVFFSAATRFAHYVENLFRHGSFGVVFQPRLAQGITSVPRIFFSPLKYTLMATLPAWFLGSLLGIGFGVWSGYKRGKFTDNAITISVLLLFGIPTFVLAAIFLVLGPFLGLPVTFIDGLRDPVFTVGMMVVSLILPVLLLTFAGMSLLMLFTRNEVVTILNAEYIENARARGLSERTIFFKYVLRNGSIPVVTLLVPTFVLLIGGSIVVEQFFDIPGTSVVLINSIRNGEINIVMFQTIFFAILGTYATIFVDLIYLRLDPRITYSLAGKSKWDKWFKAYFKRVKNKRYLQKGPKNGKEVVQNG